MFDKDACLFYYVAFYSSCPTASASSTYPSCSSIPAFIQGSPIGRFSGRFLEWIGLKVIRVKHKICVISKGMRWDLFGADHCIWGREHVHPLGYLVSDLWGVTQ